MDCQMIRCESFSIPSCADPPKSAIFFHRFPEQDTDSVHHTEIPNCSIHSNIIATVQCIDCAKNCLLVRYSYHCSNKCLLHAWRKHILYHQYANIRNLFNEDSVASERLSRYKSWPPIDLVSWFDEKVELVIPTGSKWINKVGPINALVPFADDIGFSFKLQPTSLDQLQAATEVYVTDPTIQRLKLSPRFMSWLPGAKEVEKINGTKRVSQVGKFSILTYNMLSDIYAYVDKYPFCPQWALAWEYRRKNLLHEIILYDADILCLQEVQNDHFENFFKPVLKNFGYSVVYKKKTKEVYTGKGYIIDGCAIFFRHAIFQNAIAYELEFSNSALSLMGKLDASLRDQARVRLMKDNVALAIVLEVVGDAADGAASLSKLCVVNTHLYAGKGFPDVRLLQVSDLINEIEKIIDPEMPLLVCGDINSFPGSDPYVLLTKHEVSPARAEDPLHIYQHLKLRHSIKLANAYAAAYPNLVNDVKGHRITMMHPETGERFFTSLTPFHGSTLDYIFYSEDSLEVEGLLELPKLETIGRALPTPFWSSDHIALMGSFKITRPFLG